MAENHYVYSTMTTDVRYVQYSKSANDIPVVESFVDIAGGANVPDKHLVTPRGVVTKITSEQLALLEGNPLFKRHQENGFIIVDTVKVDPEVKASDMEQRDDSAPLTPEDFPKSGDEDKDNPGGRVQKLKSAIKGAA